MTTPEPKPGTPLHDLTILMAQARIRIAREAAERARGTESATAPAMGDATGQPPP